MTLTVGKLSEYGYYYVRPKDTPYVMILSSSTFPSLFGEEATAETQAS